VMQLLQGLVTVVDGLSGVSNQMADRHAVTRRPARHHAELAVNAARTLASFMASSFAYQRDRGTLGGAVQPPPGAAQDSAESGERRPPSAFSEPT
jgi:hypothetical protein